MSIHKKMETAINDVSAINIIDEKVFFEQQLIPKIQVIRDLMLFPYIHHNDFHEYLEIFRNDIQLDINACQQIKADAPIEEKEALLNLVKSHIKAKMRVVVFAFSYYLQNKALLYKEEKGSSIYTMNTSNNDSYGPSVIYSK
ncbi:MAG: hypothetical protein V4717_13760 [Bacteroidota bacterium]